MRRTRLHRWIRDGVTFVPVEVAMHERGRSRECIYRMAREGRIRSVRHGRYVYVEVA